MTSFPDAECTRQSPPRFPGEGGSALLLVLLVLSIFTLLGLFMTLEATTGLHISDNYESRARAEYAARAGLGHARALMRGLDNDALLKGPDGVHNPGASYLELAKRYDFRNPLSLVSAQAVNIADPAADVSGIPDDGLVNTGAYGGVDGIPLIPMTGIAQKVSNPGSTEAFTASRYFVKVADNNGDASETAGDPGDNPFDDGDGVIIVRSMGVAGTVSDFTGSIRRRNSVVVYEGRYRKYSVFDLGPALVVIGPSLFPAFEGTFEITGDPSPGIGVVDTDPDDAVFPERIIGAGPLGSGTISGGGLPRPSIQDMTAAVESDPQKSSILNPGYVHDFVFHKVPGFSDSYFDTDQHWDERTCPDIGSYDPAKSPGAPGQSPKMTVVHGNLQMTGSIRGGGLLVVTGEFECRDNCRYDGLVLVIGSGQATIETLSGINGGLVIAKLDDTTGVPLFGIPDFSIQGNSLIAAYRSAVKMALGLIPPVQEGFREIAGTDP